MDTTLVDVTEISSAVEGDGVVLIGRRDVEPAGEDAPETGFAATLAVSLAAVDSDGTLDGDGEPGATDAIRVEEVADWAGTIPHEILSRLDPRVPRRYLTRAARGHEVSR